MARFRGTVQGNRGGASRLGKNLRVTADGWNLGVEVIAEASSHDGDTFVVSVTSGSKRQFSSFELATISVDKDGYIEVKQKDVSSWV